jgi:hypothetical protein
MNSRASPRALRATSRAHIERRRKRSRFPSIHAAVPNIDGLERRTSGFRAAGRMVDHRSRDSNFSAASLERAERGTMDERSRHRWFQTPVGNELRVEAFVHRVSASPRSCSRTASLPNGLPCSKRPKLLIDTAAPDRRNDAVMRLERTLDWSRQDHILRLHARAVGLFETSLNHRARCCESVGIGVPVFLPKIRAHCAVMSAIVY